METRRSPTNCSPPYAAALALSHLSGLPRDVVPPPMGFLLSAFASGIFALVSAIIRTGKIPHPGYALVGESTPYRGWDREGFGTQRWE